MPFPLRPRLRHLLPVSILCLLGSCRTADFYSQAVRGQADILYRSRPIAVVQRNPKTKPALRKQLDLVQELRTFAHDELKLPTDRQYKNYADLDRKYVVWNVYAAPEFSLEAKTWRYPMVGNLKYRGFFNEAQAKQVGATLEKDGYDVLVGGVRVYSTLGWFSDPVLNTFVHEEDSQLAETLFHELTHARFFVAGDTDFNEAYATASAQLGVRQWLQRNRDAKKSAAYERSIAQFDRILALLRETRANLEALYAQKGAMPEEEMRKQKAAVFEASRETYAAMKRRGEADDSFDRLLGKQLNNARLIALATYYDLVPAFERLFHEQGGDWEKFHRAVEDMKPLSRRQRRERLGAVWQE